MGTSRQRSIFADLNGCAVFTVQPPSVNAIIAWLGCSSDKVGCPLKRLSIKAMQTGICLHHSNTCFSHKFLWMVSLWCMWDKLSWVVGPVVVCSSWVNTITCGRSRNHYRTIAHLIHKPNLMGGTDRAWRNRPCTFPVIEMLEKGYRRTWVYVRYI